MITPQMVRKGAKFMRAGQAIPEARAEYMTRTRMVSEHTLCLAHPHGLGIEMLSIFADKEIHAKYLATAENYAPVVEAAWPFLQKNFKLWDDLLISFGAEPLGTSGTTIQHIHISELDITARDDQVSQYDNFIDTILHELTHVDQLATGRMVAIIGDDDLPCGRTWDGKHYDSVTDPNKEFKRYLGLPWEENARENSQRLAPALKTFLKDAGCAIPPDTSFKVKKQLDRLAENLETSINNAFNFDHDQAKRAMFQSLARELGDAD